jgi:pimeloyl-ACP methyl ester carboxylesterase
MPEHHILSRRQALVALGAVPFGAVAAGTAGAEARIEAKPATFVLVHGGWHGGWCWTRLAPLLRAGGYPVFAPTLTGLGERAHLLTPDVDLDLHIRDITAVLEYEDLRHAALVGHSYGGMVIAGVAAQVGPRISQLVYLDAFLPENGKAIQDYAPLPPTQVDGWRVPPPASASGFGITDERDAAWVDARLGDQPLRTLTQGVRLSDPAVRLPQSFILCRDAPWFVEAAERARRQGFRYREMLSAGHDAMLTQPDALAKVLDELTQRS